MEESKWQEFMADAAYGLKLAGWTCIVLAVLAVAAHSCASAAEGQTHDRGMVANGPAAAGFQPGTPSAGRSNLKVRHDEVIFVPRRAEHDLDGDGTPEVVVEGSTIQLKIDGCDRVYDAPSATWTIECDP